MPLISLPSLAPLIDNLEEGVLFLDQHRNVLAINEAALTMLGHKPEGVVGMLCPSLFRGTRCARACDGRGDCALAAGGRAGPQPRDAGPVPVDPARGGQ